MNSRKAAMLGTVFFALFSANSYADNIAENDKRIVDHSIYNENYYMERAYRQNDLLWRNKESNLNNRFHTQDNDNAYVHPLYFD